MFRGGGEGFFAIDGKNKLKVVFKDLLQHFQIIRFVVNQQDFIIIFHVVSPLMRH